MITKFENRIYKIIDNNGYYHTSLYNIPINNNYTKITNNHYYLVYFINTTLNDRWREWLLNTICLIKKNKYKLSNVYIVAIINKKNEIHFKSLLDEMLNDLNIIFYFENNLSEVELKNGEYYGILKAWELSQLHNDYNSFIMYSHSKGITRCNKFIDLLSNSVYNIFNDCDLMYSKIFDKRLITNIFNIFTDIDKIGYASSSSGFTWYNLWWCRGSYLKNVEKPNKNGGYYYNEHWNTLNSKSDFRKNYNIYISKTYNSTNIFSYYDAGTRIHHVCNNEIPDFNIINYDNINKLIIFKLIDNKYYKNIKYFNILISNHTWIKKILKENFIVNNTIYLQKLNYSFKNIQYDIKFIPNGNIPKSFNFKFTY